MIVTDVLIVGAGLAGLCLARDLRRKTVILEKSRGLGGRVATRRIDDLGLDHGAPFLPDDALVRELLRAHGLGDAVRAAPNGLFLNESMTRLPKALARGLDVRKGTRAESLRRLGRGWVVGTDTGEEFFANDVVVTAPLPQAIELLDKNRLSLPDELRSVSYTKAVMALFVTTETVAPDRPRSPRLHSILAMRERGLHPRGFVVRATPELSDELFDGPEAAALAVLRDEFSAGFSAKPSIAAEELKKWRYVLPKTHLSAPYAEVAANLWLTGDGFRHPDARGAILGACLLAGKLN